MKRNGYSFYISYNSEKLLATILKALGSLSINLEASLLIPFLVKILRRFSKEMKFLYAIKISPSSCS